MQVDASEWGVRLLSRSPPAQDAILQVGSADIPGAGILATSSTNQFSDVVEGVKLTIGGVSETPVTDHGRDDRPEPGQQCQAVCRTVQQAARQDQRA